MHSVVQNGFLLSIYKVDTSRSRWTLLILKKMAFTTICGLYQFKVMSFGLCNAQATFERMIEIILSGLHWEIYLLYIDDLIIFANSFEQHLERLSEVLSRLQKAGLKLSPKRCQLFKKQVCFLGHVVSEHGISTDPAKIRSVEQLSAPTDVYQVRSFLGLCRTIDVL